MKDNTTDTLKNYEAEAVKTDMFTVMPESHLLYYVLGLVNESGEVAGKFKKLGRAKVDLAELTEEQLISIIDECGDVLWYLTRLVNALGSSMSEVCIRNIAKLASRKERGVIDGNGDTR